MKKVKVFTGIMIFLFVLCVMSFEAFCAERAIRVTQPAYHSMSFYVYKPVNVPADFYVTFDGYLVYKGSKGVWYYGSAEKSGVAKTGYVVGSVIPSVVRLKPYNTKISSVAPVLGSDNLQLPPSPNAVVDPKSSRLIYMPPHLGAEIYNYRLMSPNASDWTQNSNFMAIGKWQKSVDHIGVLSRPAIPVAWKGDYPEVVFAWTGLQWRQLASKTQNSTAINILRREIYDLTILTNKINRLHWTEEDSHVLAQYAVMWGYQWAGQIILGRDFYQW